MIGSGWRETNQGTRNIVQRHLDCCGWHGPADFAYTNDPIDESCYETTSAARSNSGIWPPADPATTDPDLEVPTKKMKEDGCGAALVDWFRDNKLVWATSMASLVALQVMATVIAIYILSRVKKLRKLR